MSDADRALLTIAQAAVPVVSRPFKALADCLSQEEGDVIARLAAMKMGGLIRRIGPVMDPAALGLASELLAAKVAPERLDGVAADVAALPEITHCYAREHHINLWLAGVAKGPEWFGEAVRRLAATRGVQSAWRLPTIRRFKIGVHFALGQVAAGCAQPEAARHSGAPLTEMRLHFLRLVQSDLPLCPEPFAELAKRAGLREVDVLTDLRGLVAGGVIRRYGALVSHRRLGFIANAMLVVAVPPVRVESAGRLLSESPHVSHCYQRPPLPQFPYNLYVMVHGRDRAWCVGQAKELAASVGAARWEALFSTREYGKSSPDYARLLEPRVSEAGTVRLGDEATGPA
jgi:DNA-binding Lrp family transcriptional regulator